MIWHLYVACGCYRFGTRARSSAPAKSRRAVALPPRGPKQRQEAISAELARRQNERLWAEMERARQTVGPPMVLTPTVLTPAVSPSVAARRDKPKPLCSDDSLSCSWSKITTAVKNAFASSSKTKQ